MRDALDLPNPIGGETNNTYSATASGNYTVIVTATKFADRPVTITRRVEAMITQMPLPGPQEIRADIAFAP